MTLKFGFRMGKVIESYTSELTKFMCHFLLVINCTRRRILYRLWDIAYDSPPSLYFATRLALNVPDRKGSPGTISVKFCTEVKG